MSSSLVGYGRKRVIRRKRVMRGRGWFSDLMGNIKDVAEVAIPVIRAANGHGRRRVVRRRTTVKGRGWMDKLKSIGRHVENTWNRGKDIYNKHSNASTVSTILKDFGLHKQGDWVKKNTGLGRKRRVARRGRGQPSDVDWGGISHATRMRMAGLGRKRVTRGRGFLGDDDLTERTGFFGSYGAPKSALPLFSLRGRGGGRMARGRGVASITAGVGGAGSRIRLM